MKNSILHVTLLWQLHYFRVEKINTNPLAPTSGDWSVLLSDLKIFRTYFKSGIIYAIRGYLNFKSRIIYAIRGYF